MSRSVSYPRDCHMVCFRAWYPDVCTEDDLYDEWEYVIEWIKTCAEKWPSLTECDTWIGREDHAILETNHCYIGVSEYCGMAANGKETL